MSQNVTSMTISNIQDYPYFTYSLEQEKRKGLTESCNHCQKARLTCDGARPCQGCIKRDLSTTCSDITRKRLKSNHYSPQNEQLSLFATPTMLPFTPADQPIDFPQIETTTTSLSHFMDNCALFNFSLTDLGFGSETAGLEYGVLGNMTDKQQDCFQPATPFSPIFTSSFHSSPVTPSSTTSQQQQQQQVQYSVSPVQQSSAQTPSSTTKQPTKRKSRSPESVYNSVQKPFNYAEGFHYLIQYVTEKMSRDDLKRISRALSLFRPSFLSLIMNLTEEDLVFMEKCIQRTLLEYEKLISFSGTPTVVWRRTGEVCLVGKEFSLLTQWTKDMLLNKKTYIYELMENQSAVEYWEKFSSHAFDNTDKACSYSCILRTPQKKPVPCTFCFTIKRDIFDLPSVIVGNFLPILS
ncbi:hypothetical protein G6F70_004966 [Rhizopus microsporus]|uniref:Zn(2)-C6 fungal-type domain-containing protein n=1 Tax=Rhizopus microsporus TaxID=58291 RepID=A0A1X0S6M8_RHIZD|nr:hypothetical protein G6F71_001156 [Rhizopus microsporus]KAG1199390.1 hypothetical protein G6F70_004966 [Rhizopus microsporus]KAG1214685.1 hypothetical protein G6F69_001720 [Rhizopus microsporus]KAG1236569.1 hypothetical protein G6F67_001875 [Rhizopus microsporus]KAG1268313.1 hypothetical protein G6F68_001221 [Rhizopus microsporus]